MQKPCLTYIGLAAMPRSYKQQMIVGDIQSLRNSNLRGPLRRSWLKNMATLSIQPAYLSPRHESRDNHPQRLRNLSLLPPRLLAEHGPHVVNADLKPRVTRTRPQFRQVLRV
jgi:hypothetical protein